jgi:integrase
LRPGEGLALRWGDVRERTLLVERALSLGAEKDTKTRAHRTGRLLTPLAADLREWRMRAGPPRPRPDLRRPRRPTVERARVRVLAQARVRARRQGSGHPSCSPARSSPQLRASLLLHEGRSVIYDARQLGHGAHLTLSTYGHVIDELDDAPRQDAEITIQLCDPRVWWG